MKFSTRVLFLIFLITLSINIVWAKEMSAPAVEGKLLARKGQKITVVLNEVSAVPQSEALCEVSRQFNTSFAGMDVSGWVKTVKAKIVSVKEKKVQALVVEKLSEGTVDGKPTDFLKVNDVVRLDCL